MGFFGGGGSSEAASVPVGTIMDFASLTPPTGWLSLCVDGKIGDANSYAHTQTRRNADCETLFKLLWAHRDSAYERHVLNVYDASGGDANASSLTADEAWAQHYSISLPDLRGRVAAGYDLYNQALANVDSYSSYSPALLEKLGNNNAGPLHSHGVDWDPSGSSSYEAAYVSSDTGGSSYAIQKNTQFAGSNQTSLTTSYVGDGGSYNGNCPPTLLLNKIIKL